MNDPSSDKVTRGIRVCAAAQYVPKESSPADNRFLYVYRITISNEGDVPVQLRSRHWVIIDADNNRKDVEGEGVVGKQPRLAPGESFEYMSWCPLETRWGTMEGSYRVEVAEGESFDVEIGRFFLVPNAPRMKA